MDLTPNRRSSRETNRFGPTVGTDGLIEPSSAILTVDRCSSRLDRCPPGSSDTRITHSYGTIANGLMRDWPVEPTMIVGDTTVSGVGLDADTRCAHYDSPRDVIAIRFPCCGEYYACHACHGRLADHDAERWSETAHDERAILCGVCGGEHTIAAYLDCDHACPDCDAAFNPGCANHYHCYFAGVSEVSGSDRSYSGV